MYQVTTPEQVVYSGPDYDEALEAFIDASYNAHVVTMSLASVVAK